ncbi:MAG: PAS domain-containing protein, partial [Methanomicrobiales archaeon]|nr:PAS domain-containing protein [Methanomicrobiales archaeon]
GEYAMNRIKSLFGTYHPLLIDYLNKPEENLPSLYSEVKRTNDSISAEFYLPIKKAYIWVKASPLYDQKGNFIGGIETMKDISDWKRAEQSLEKTRKTIASETEEKIKILINENEKLVSELENQQEPLKTRILLEKGLDSCDRRILIVDYKGFIRYASDSMVSLVGGEDRKELINSNIFDKIDTVSSQSLLQLLFTQSSEPISLECSFYMNEHKIVAPLTASLIRQDENILGFIIHDQGYNLPQTMEAPADYSKDKINNILGDHKTKLLGQILMMVPFLPIIADILEFI